MSDGIIILLAILIIAVYVSRVMKRKKIVNPYTTHKIEIQTSQPQHMPQERTDNQPDKDAWEGSFWEASNPVKIETTLHLDYVDSNGNETSRTVDVHKYDESLSGGMIIGFCHIRQATRTFLIDRIKQCVIEETGEVIDDVRKYLKQTYENSVHSSVDKLFDEEYDYLRILLYVGKADGRLAQKEIDVIAEACRRMVGDDRITSGFVTDMLKEMDVPSQQAFSIAVGRLTSLPDEKKSILIRQAEKIIGTQKSVHPTEQYAIDYMKKRLLPSISAVTG